MKKMLKMAILLPLMLFVLLNTVTAGGPEFRELRKVKLPFTPSTHWYSHTGDFRYFLCSTKSDMLMVDGLEGKILWQKNFEKDFGNKKFSNQFWNKDANVILVFDEDTKSGIAKKYFIDGKTGSLLWSGDKYVSGLGEYELSVGFSSYYDPGTMGVLLPAKESVDLVNVTNGNVIWSKPIVLTGKAKKFDCFIMRYYDLVKIINSDESETFLTTAEGKEVTEIEPYFNKKRYLADRKNASLINIPDKDMYVIRQGETNAALMAFAGIDLQKTKMTFKGYSERDDKLLWTKVYSVPAWFDWITYEPLVKMFYSDGMLFVEHAPDKQPNTGLTVLDPTNGEILWQASFKTGEIKTAGLSKNLLTPFPAPDPVTLNGKTFVVNKAKNVVSCYEASSGKKLWDTENYPDAQKIPSLFVSNNLVIMGHGGDAIKCAGISQTSGPSIYRYEYNHKDKYGIIAYDAATGKMVWDSDMIGKKVKDGFDYIAGLELIDGKLYCATDKNFFVMDPATGNVLSSIPVAKEKLGDAWKMFWFDDQKQIILNCDDGIAKIDPAAGKVVAVVRTPTVASLPPTVYMNADDPYADFAIFTSGDATKMSFKEFASVDLDKMIVRGEAEADLLFFDNPHFSEGGEMFYRADGALLSIFSVK